jgi:anionic cell wall polymer biosynthesis LytR-Cps2A-Psr (LCP) family protein
MQNYSWGLFEGVNILTGETALAYSRIRALQGGDFNRTNRQRTVMMALLNKAKDMPVTDLYNLVEALIPMVVTDMSNSEIVAAAMDLAPLLQDLEIISQRIPIDDGYNMTMVDGMSVLLPDLEMNREFLVDTIGIDE